MSLRPPAPILPPQVGTLEQRVTVLTQALARKSDATLEPVFSAVLLLAPGGLTYRLSVDDAGALHTVAVAR